MNLINIASLYITVFFCLLVDAEQLWFPPLPRLELATNFIKNGGKYYPVAFDLYNCYFDTDELLIECDVEDYTDKFRITNNEIINPDECDLHFNNIEIVDSNDKSVVGHQYINIDVETYNRIKVESVDTDCTYHIKYGNLNSISYKRLNLDNDPLFDADFYMENGDEKLYYNYCQYYHSNHRMSCLLDNGKGNTIVQFKNLRFDYNINQCERIDGINEVARVKFYNTYETEELKIIGDVCDSYPYEKTMVFLEFDDGCIAKGTFLEYIEYKNLI